ncbi:hypothetical protein EDB86DRAFT_2940341 [Lactarius hatsudake]|nr:hypothetical protein EDB86DRAFT_2940341 [Lactarius hatsudake]
MPSRPPADENRPFGESDSTFYFTQGACEAHPQDASSGLYPDPRWPLLYKLLQELGLLHDGADASQPLEPLIHHRDASQFPPPEAAQSADLATDVQVLVVGAPGGSNGGASPLCETCNIIFGRPQEFKRHMDQTHQPPRQCPFNPCAYKWKRPDKIKAHITNKHRKELCPEVFQILSALRGKRIIEFLDGYERGHNFKTPTEPYVSFSLPPLAPFENPMLSDYFGCSIESLDVVPSKE